MVTHMAGFSEQVWVHATQQHDCGLSSQVCWADTVLDAIGRIHALCDNQSQAQMTRNNKSSKLY